MRRIVVDASVVLKWYLPDEEYGDKALSLLEGHVSERLSLYAPALIEFELANALSIAKRRGRVADEDALKAMAGFAELGIDLHPLEQRFSEILACCDKYSVSAYDAAYVALAAGYETDFVTADKRLCNALHKLKFVKWIGDIRA